MFKLMMAILVFTSGALAQQQAEIPHLPIDSSGYSYLPYSQTVQVPLRDAWDLTDGMEPIIDMGVRNLEWLQNINEKSKKNISISKPENMRAYPVHSPRIYNREIVLQEFNELKAALPEVMHKVLFENAPLTDKIPLEQAEYEEWALKVDRTYQSAARWRMMQSYLPALAARRTKDVRGYYFLKDIQNLDQKLVKVPTMPADEKEKYTTALVLLCVNANLSVSTCTAELQRHLQQNTTLTFKNKYWARAKTVWNGYFDIPYFGKFPDVRWSKNNLSEARVPFRRPATTELEDFLKLNIEDEWQWESWKLIVDFDLSSTSAIDVRFEPGITPHVPGLGSNIIYMDANAPLSEWDVQWTIRHEFGHNLGFPDCYHEFYDTEKSVIIGYQIDIDDLMCSRRGELKARHFEQMKEAYFN